MVPELADGDQILSPLKSVTTLTAAWKFERIVCLPNVKGLSNHCHGDL